MIAVVGVVTLGVTLVYVRTWFGLLYGTAAALLLLGVASRLKPAVSEFLLAAIGATSCLYAVWDVASDVLRRHSGASDAAALARLTGVPAVLWGVAWIGAVGRGAGRRPAQAGLRRGLVRGMTPLSVMHESRRCLTIARSAAVQSPVGSDEPRRTSRTIPFRGRPLFGDRPLFRGQAPHGDKRETLRT